MISHEHTRFLRNAIDLEEDKSQLRYEELCRLGLVETRFDGGWTYRITSSGREVLAAYDRKWVVVERDALEFAVDSLDVGIREYDQLYAGRDALLARRNDDRAALLKLQASLAGEQPKPEPPAFWDTPEGDRWIRGRISGDLIWLSGDDAVLHRRIDDEWFSMGVHEFEPGSFNAEFASQAHTILWPELQEAK